MNETEAAPAILLVALGIKLSFEKKRFKKQKIRTTWVKKLLNNHICPSAYHNIFQKLRLRDNEEFRRYLRMNIDTYLIDFLWYLFID